ncbi:helix-turn-helix transcriptional regulator [Mycolicibacterium fortuitum]|uniref:helix-turn-helix transcriptional regulator n=1 Tax=Mycolicibacterium fortuitum TaxID=1766 RepID=UPI0026151E99|nr:helix-turn-helix domain-containing protein [Mycolicibacterium fortuitum]
MEPGHDQLLTIPEAIQALRISRTHFFRLKRRGEIVGIQLGYRTLIPAREIQRLIEERYHPPSSGG